MLMSFPLKCIAVILVIANIVRAVFKFNDTKHSARLTNLDAGISLALAGCFALMMSQNLLVEAFAMIMGLIFQVLQIGDDHLTA